MGSKGCFWKPGPLPCTRVRTTATQMLTSQWEDLGERGERKSASFSLQNRSDHAH